jgi:hypothetical protein
MPTQRSEGGKSRLPLKWRETVNEKVMPTRSSARGKSRLQLNYKRAMRRCSSGVERFLGKEEVMGSIPIIGSK